LLGAFGCGILGGGAVGPAGERGPGRGRQSHTLSDRSRRCRFPGSRPRREALAGAGGEAGDRFCPG
jgi:hypothetical protein